VTAWAAFYSRLVGPIEVEHTVLPVDVAGPALILDDTPEGAQLEHDARLAHAAHLVERALYAQGSKAKALRNDELVDALLDMRAALRPSVADPTQLHEVTS
jgi:hypothetical protein